MGQRILAAARTALHQLYDHMTQERGAPPTLNEFYPVNVADLIHLQGWEAKVVQSAGVARDLAQADLAGQAVGRTKTIYVTRDETNPGRERFTLAHELGHVLLHDALCRGDSLERATAARDISRPRPRPLAEREANRFATELLLPPKAVRQRFEETFGTPPLARMNSRGKELLMKAEIPSRVSVTATKLAELAAVQRDPGKPSLAEFFGVSRATMAIRLLELGLVT